MEVSSRTIKVRRILVCIYERSINFLLCYCNTPTAKTVGSESDRTSNDFRRFLQSLIDAGYTKLNIIGHSMGARIFMSALNKGVIDDLLVVREHNFPYKSSELCTYQTISHSPPIQLCLAGRKAKFACRR